MLSEGPRNPVPSLLRGVSATAFVTQRPPILEAVRTSRNIHAMLDNARPVAWEPIHGKQDRSGLMYMRNRYSDPASGWFTQEDPIGLTGGLNLYGFAKGDPVNFSDPFGLSPTCLGGAIGGFVLGFGLSRITGSSYGVGSALLDAGLGCLGVGLGSKLARLRRARALAATEDAVAAVRRADPNKLHHIFGQAKHNLDDFVKNFDSQDDAFFAIQDAAQAVLDAGQLAADARGVFTQTVRVAGQELTVEGRVIDGIVRIGTAYR